MENKNIKSKERQRKRENYEEQMRHRMQEANGWLQWTVPIITVNVNKQNTPN